MPNIIVYNLNEFYEMFESKQTLQQKIILLKQAYLILAKINRFS